MLELQLLVAARGQIHLQVMRVDDFGEPLQITHLPMFHELAGAAGQPLDDVVLEGAELREVDLRLPEFNSPCLRVARFVDQLGDVQQRLGRDAAAIDADAAGIHFRVDERGRKSEIGGEKCCGVSPGTAADDDHLD